MPYRNLRYALFWISDLIKGKPIGKHFEEISYINQYPNSSDVLELINNYLYCILQHAIKTTPFYRNLKIEPEIKNFPVINKNLIRQNFNQFRSEEYANKKLIKMITSGSTGTPFTVFQDKTKKMRHYADTIYFSKIAGYELGHKLFYLKIWSDNNQKSSFETWKQNIVPIDVLRLTDNVISKMLDKIKVNKSTIGLLGYSSAFDTIIKYLDNYGPDIIESNISSVISTSETLNPQTRSAMSKYFQIPVVSRYSNLENGIIAQQCFLSNEFHINAASYLVEILDIDKDIPVEAGKLGRIVLTDYFNFAMPLIRYDTGDLGSFAENSECNIRTPVLTKIEGRKLDQIYDTKGNHLSSYLVYKNMWKYTEITQYQIIQEGVNMYTIRLNTNTVFKREKELLSEFLDYLGHDAVIRVDYVNEIPMLSSGKRRKVVNNYIKE